VTDGRKEEWQKDGRGDGRKEEWRKDGRVAEGRKEG
jgi:hypothetical protein